jgi:hypothetical protein
MPLGAVAATGDMRPMKAERDFCLRCLGDGRKALLKRVAMAYKRDRIV